MTTMATDGFGVFGYMQGVYTLFGSDYPNTFYNKQVTGGTGAWSYDGEVNWSQDDNVVYSFIAYAPYAQDIDDDILSFTDNDNEGVPSITVAIPTDASTMVDLVAGQVYNIDKYGNTYSVNSDAEEGATGADAITVTGTSAEIDEVSLNLKHQLTRLNFTAKFKEGIDESTYAVIKSFKILGSAPTPDSDFLPNGTDAFGGTDYEDDYSSSALYSKGVYTFASVTTANSTETDHAHDGTWVVSAAKEASYDLTDIVAWVESDDTDSSGDSVYPFDQNIKDNYAETGVFVQGYGDDSDDAKVVNLFAEDQYLFLLPPNVYDGLTPEAKSDALNIQIELIYDIVTINEGDDSTTSGLATGHIVTTTNSYAIVDLTAGSLKHGYAYQFDITINGKGDDDPTSSSSSSSTQSLDAISLSATVMNWDVTELTTYTVDGETVTTDLTVGTED